MKKGLFIVGVLLLLVVSSSFASANIFEDAWEWVRGVFSKEEVRFAPLDGDANDDCFVNVLDLIFVRNNLGCDTTKDGDDCIVADVNGDGFVNVLDLIFVRNNLGTGCDSDACPDGDLDGYGYHWVEEGLSFEECTSKELVDCDDDVRDDPYNSEFHDLCPIDFRECGALIEGDARISGCAICIYPGAVEVCDDDIDNDCDGSYCISGCGELDVEGRIYVLSDNIVNNELTDDCIKITAPGITLDCGDGAGGRYSITSDDSYVGVFSDQLNTVVKNCEISMGGWVDILPFGRGGTGIRLNAGASGSEIINNFLHDQYHGISVRGDKGEYVGDGVNDLLIENNIITSEGGFDVFLDDDVPGAMIIGNTMCGGGIYCMGSGFDEVGSFTGNTCEKIGNECGLELSCEPCLVLDNCPGDAEKTELGICGCGVADIDGDGDEVMDCNDNCPGDANPLQENCNSDDKGDVCDVINPGADEVCDGEDNDCDILTEDGFGEDATCPLKQGVCAGVVKTCEGSEGWSDCDYGVYYEVDEVSCDDKDNDCDGEVDEGCAECTDIDDDGWYVEESGCENEVGFLGHDDCIDGDGLINPGAEEVCDDGIDNDCDGSDCISGCGELDVEGRIYVLSDNIVNNELTDDCIKITAPGITLDCDDGAGGRYSIKSDDAYIGVFSNQPNTVVKNCEISMSGTDWVDSPVPPMFGYWISGYGIKLEYGADGSKIINNDLSGQSYGISIEGVSSGDKINNLVIKDNRMNVNEVNGISIENVLNVEVENNEVCGNEGVSIFCFGATGVSFVEDNKCDSNTCGGLSCEPCPECVITKLYWSQSEIISKGERVDLVIEGESCEGIEIENVEVFEEDSEIGFLSDIFNPDDVVLKNPSVEGVVFSGGEARVTWTAEFQEDEVGGPEYYFKVIVDGETYTSSKVAGEMLEVQAVDRGTQEGRTITLSPGKNLISIPLILDSMSVEGVFSGISGVEKIYAYDEEWEIYHFDGKPSNLVSLEPGKGYVVVMAENAEVVDLNILGYKRTVEKTLPTIKLKKGWNFIGTFALAEEVGADVLFREIQDYDLYEWDDTTKGYVLVGKEIVLDETKSYWIFVRDEIEEVDISPIVRLAPEDE